ncbi:MAG: TIR domain-containing protein [Alphaproteobacteria bacterium]|nr:TIR domain-containing protein [Alphaproteobacteria bacterium]
MKFDFFVSYQRSDRELVAQVVRRLEGSGVTVWYDANIDGDADWRETAREALTESATLVVFFSGASNGSHQLKKELAVADGLGKPIVPVLIEDTQPRGARLYDLADRNWIEAWPDPASKVDDLVDHLIALTSKAAAAAIPENGAPVAASAANDELPIQPSATAAVYIGKMTAGGRRVPARDVLPFKWIDLLVLVPVLGLTVFRALGPDGAAGATAGHRLATIGLACLIMVALYGAVAFPIRYYLRRRGVGAALGKYLISTGILVGLVVIATAAAAAAGAVAPENVAGAVSGLILIWVFFTVIAFSIYAMLGGWRALRAFRSNIRKI